VYQLVVYVPDSHREAVKEALFAAGAGAAGAYTRCCWQVQGEGQFCAQPGSRPALGRIGEDTQLGEWRIEMICVESCLSAAVTALRAAHPYEQPAFSVWRLAAI